MLRRRLLLAGRLLPPASSASSIPPTPKIVCYQGRLIRSTSYYFYSTSDRISQEAGSGAKELPDPFAQIKDQVSEVTKRLCSMVIAEVPELTSAAAYYFRAGVEGKRTCPTVLLLMASAIGMDMMGSIVGLENGPCARAMRVAEITEMIHILSLVHDDILDDAETRRGMDSLHRTMGTKLAVLAGDFLLSRAFSAAVSLDNTEVISLLATAVNNLVAGEFMQMSITSAQRFSMDYYLHKSYYKTATLISHSCKAIAVLAGQKTEVQGLAYQYGKHLGIAYQLIDDILDFTGTSASLGKSPLSDIRQGILTGPILFAIEEFPELREIVEQGFDDQSNVDMVLKCLSKSQGIQRTRLLAAEHAKQAADAIDALPESKDQVVLNSRQALKDLTQKLLRRTK